MNFHKFLKFLFTLRHDEEPRHAAWFSLFFFICFKYDLHCFRLNQISKLDMKHWILNIMDWYDHNIQIYL